MKIFKVSMTLVQGVGGFFLLLLIVNSGFIIVRSSIPPWVICFYWISPFAYSIRGLVINEFTSPRWDRPLPFGEKSMGDTALESLDFYTDRCVLLLVFWFQPLSCFGFIKYL